MTNQDLELAFRDFFDEKFDKIFFTLHKRYLKSSTSSHDDWQEKHQGQATAGLRIVSSENEQLNSEQLRDYVEEAFTKFYYKKLYTDDITPSKWEGYVYTIANNLVMDFFRKEKKIRKSVNSEPKARPSDKNLLLSDAEHLDMQQVKTFLNIADDDLEQSGQRLLVFLSNLVSLSIGFIPNQKHIASILLQDENYQHLPFTEAKERINTRSVSEWYTRGKQGVINQIQQVMQGQLDEWLLKMQAEEVKDYWKAYQELLQSSSLDYQQLEVQYKQIFGAEIEQVFLQKSEQMMPPMFELLILLDEKKYQHRKLVKKALSQELKTSKLADLQKLLNKQLKLPIDLVRRFFKRQLPLSKSALQVHVIAACLKQKREAEEIQD